VDPALAGSCTQNREAAIMSVEVHAELLCGIFANRLGFFVAGTLVHACAYSRCLLGLSRKQDFEIL
jgi:hypothetical protein